jgi:hypothetical protein
MTDRALSLLRTMLHPVLSSLPFGAGRDRANLPLAPHHAVPAIHLSGVILERSRTADPAVAEAMYSGSFDFAGEHVTSLPDTVFTCTAPSRAWRTELLRLDWLASFRASGKSLHGLFALRLLSAWVSARPRYSSSDDQITALYNLSVDAAAIAATQSPAAIAIATAAILQAQQPVARMRPDTVELALERSIALLAAHLATKRPDSQRNKLIHEMTDALQEVVAPDGSLPCAGLSRLCVLHGKLETVMRGLDAAGEAPHPRLAEAMARITSYKSLLRRPDGSLAFADVATLKLPPLQAPGRNNALAETAGHARLAGGKALLLASFGAEREARPLQLEIHDGDAPLLWLQQHNGSLQPKRASCSLICAAGGSLLEITYRDRDDARLHLAIFLSGDGSDLRLEDTSGTASAASYLLHVPDQARLSTSHGGAGAMIVLNSASAWQVLVRGGHIELESGFLNILPDGGANGPLNFALKRISQSDRTPRPTKSSRAAAERARAEQSPRLL